MKNFKKILIINFIYFSSVLTGDFGILVNVFKAADHQGSFVNHYIKRFSDENIEGVLTMVKLCYAFHDLDQATDYVIWNGRKIPAAMYKKSFKSIGAKGDNSLDIILTPHHKRMHDEPPYAMINRQNMISSGSNICLSVIGCSKEEFI